MPGLRSSGSSRLSGAPKGDFYVFGMVAYVEDALEASVTPHYSEVASLFASCAPEALIKYFE
jgi:hypothetical protein